MKAVYSIVICFALLQSCENDIAKVNSIGTGIQKKLPVESSKNVEFLYSDSAKVQMKLMATQIDRFAGEKPYFEMNKGMHIYFYNKYPHVQTELKADYGIGFDNTVNGIMRMEVKRNVVVINEKGDKLNTEHLIWDAQKKRIYTDKFVRITNKEGVICGNGLDADEDFSHYEIKNITNSHMNIKDSI